MSYNSGRGRDVFATRVRILRQHPEIWRQVPAGAWGPDWQNSRALQQLWREIAGFLATFGVVSLHTQWQDVNVPKIVAAVRKLEKEEAA